MSQSDQVVEAKITDLISKMTLDEKMGQLNQYTSQWKMTGPAPQGMNQQRMLEMIRTGQVGSMLNVTGAEATRNAQKLAMENSCLKIPMIFGYDVIHGYQTMFPIPLAEAASPNWPENHHALQPSNHRLQVCTGLSRQWLILPAMPDGDV